MALMASLINVCIGCKFETYSLTDCFAKLEGLLAEAFAFVEMSGDETMNDFLSTFVNKGTQQLSLLTFSFSKSAADQPKTSSRLYPPRPGRATSPVGFGIFSCCSKVPVSLAGGGVTNLTTRIWEDVRLGVMSRRVMCGVGAKGRMAGGVAHLRKGG